MYSFAGDDPTAEDPIYYSMLEFDTSKYQEQWE
jgi:hypothetical protein